MNQETCKLPDTINFQQEFNDILSFVAEVCEVPYAFITHLDSENQSIISKIGFDFLTIPENILSYNKTIIEQNTFFKFSNDLKHQPKKTTSSDFSFDFFSGLPIYSNENLVIGTLCVMDVKSKELSLIQLKTLHHSARQVQAILNLWKKNHNLQKVFEKKENQIQLFIENSNEITYELTKNGIITYVSKNLKTFLGYEIEEVIGKSNTSFIHAKDLKNIVAVLDNIAKSGEIKNEIAHRILHKDGHYVWYASNIRLFKIDGKITYIGNCRVITEQIELRQKFLQQKEFYEKILDKIPTDIAVFDSNQNYLYLNSFAIKNEDLRKFIIGKNDFEYAKHTGRNTIYAQKRRVKFLEATLSKNIIEWEENFIGLNGKSTCHSRKFNPVFDGDGKLDIMIGFGVDITELKKAEKDLKISNERFTYSSEATSDAIWDWNLLNDKIYVGGSYSPIFGHYFKDNIIMASECDAFLHPEDKEFYIKNLTEALENETIIKWSDEYRYIKSDGNYADVSDNAIIIRNEKGKAIRMIGAMQDITNKKKLENELQKSEEQFRGAFDFSPIGMALVNIEGYYIKVNDKLCEILGYSNQEMKSLSFQEITYHKDLKIDLENKENLDSGKTTNFSSEKRFIKKDKSIVWAHMSVSLAKNSKNEIYYIVQILDISERKKIEQHNKLLSKKNIRNKAILLNEAKNKYRFLAENTVDLICLHDLDTTFQYLSPSAITILGYHPEELEGKSPLEFAHHEDLKYLQDSFTDFIYKKVNDSTTARFRTKGGKYIWLETKANIVEVNGVANGFQSSSRDVTARIEEEKATEKALSKERELNELRTNLVSTISHEFRTPMTTIRTSAELIAIYMDGQTNEKALRVNKQLNTITGEIDRIIELMNSVLTISKEDSGKTNFNPIGFDLKQLCINIIETSYDNRKDGRKVITSFKGNNFIVFADKSLMGYSLFNLLNNAFKYSKGSGDVVFNLKETPSKLIIEIIDFGIGIPKEDKHKLFNTFFRASNTNGIQGTGLGLYIVKTFVEKNSGNIKIKSQLDKGTKVTLKFPIHKP